MKINCWIGLDPGVKGAVCVLRENGDHEMHRFPLTKGKVDYIKQDQLLGSLLREDDIPFIAVEHTQGVGRWGANTSHALGWSNGFLYHWAVSTGHPHVLIKPKEWQKEVWVAADYVKKATKPNAKTGKSTMKIDAKPTSSKAARRLFPDFDFNPKNLKDEDDGLIDAALLAYYAKRTSV